MFLESNLFTVKANRFLFIANLSLNNFCHFPWPNFPFLPSAFVKQTSWVYMKLRMKFF